MLIDEAAALPRVMYAPEFTVNEPGAPAAEVRPPSLKEPALVPNSSLLRTPLVATPSGDRLPVPPTKFTVAPAARVSDWKVRVAPPVPTGGAPAYPEVTVDWP